jgi:hypothetical protein
MDQALAKLAQAIDWQFFEEKCGVVYKDGPGQARQAKDGQLITHVQALPAPSRCRLTVCRSAVGHINRRIPVIWCWLDDCRAP